ncbi:MAG: hypothetical protein DWQ30_11290 [Acidobacteria bacterium]|nr:MAG: hypothetical protein DWQ30_11290 [Acidobacteriota bacterium]
MGQLGQQPASEVLPPDRGGPSPSRAGDRPLGAGQRGHRRGAGRGGGVVRRWLHTLRNRRYERELAEEIEHHIDERTADLVARGLDPDGARSQARREFGSVDLVKDHCRDQDRLAWLDELTRNLRFAVRRLRRAPGVFVAVVATLALCVAANAVVFTVVDTVLFQRLPYPAPEELFEVQWSSEQSRGSLRDSVDGTMWQSLADTAPELRACVYSDWTQGVNLIARSPTGAEVATVVERQRVGSGFFELLGVPMASGRGFDIDEDRVGGAAVAVVTWRLWRDRLGAREDVLGSRLLLAGEAHTVVGVTAERFDPGTGAEVFTPLRASREGEGSGTNYRILARIGDHERAGATAALDTASRSVAAMRGDGFSFEPVPLLQARSGWLRDRLLVLWAAVGAVLLIGCVNIAGLLIAAAGRRRQEMATRRALGGGAWAVTRQLLTENLLQTACGAALGLALAGVAMRWVAGWARTALGLTHDFALDDRALLYTLAVALLATVLFSLAPTARLARTDRSSLRQRGVTDRRSKGRAVLVAGQVALGVSLLLAATLLTRSLSGLSSADPGVELEGVVSGAVSLADANFAEAGAVREYFASGVEALRADPRLVGAGAFLSLPFQRGLNMNFTLAGDDDRHLTVVNYATPGALELLAVRHVAGRLIEDRDRSTSPLVAVVNQTFTELHLAGRQPLGARISLMGAEREVVGVVGDVRQVPSFSASAPLARDVPTVYLPADQFPVEAMGMVHTWFQPHWVVRARATPAAGTEALRSAIERLEPVTPIARISGLEEARARALAVERFQALLFAVLALLALVLAAVGLAGITATEIGARRREMAVRIALGSSLPEVVRRAILPILGVAAIGLAIGLLLAQLGGRALRGMLHGIGTDDPWSHLIVIGCLVGVAVLACAPPALRLLRLPVASVLQDEA